MFRLGKALKIKWTRLTYFPKAPQEKLTMSLTPLIKFSIQSLLNLAPKHQTETLQELEERTSVRVLKEEFHHQEDLIDNLLDSFKLQTWTLLMMQWVLTRDFKDKWLILKNNTPCSKGKLRKSLLAVWIKTCIKLTNLKLAKIQLTNKWTLKKRNNLTRFSTKWNLAIISLNLREFLCLQTRKCCKATHHNLKLESVQMHTDRTNSHSNYQS